MGHADERHGEDDFLRDRERDRNKEREKNRDRDREKERDREREKEKARDREKERDRERERAREREKGKERAKDRDREREKDRDRSKERERSREEREKDRERDGVNEREERERERQRERDRDVLRSREKEKDRDRGREKEKEKDRERDRDREKNRDKEGAKYREDQDDQKRERQRELERDSGREKEGDVSKERKKEKDKREREREKEKEKERDKGKEGVKDGDILSELPKARHREEKCTDKIRENEEPIQEDKIRGKPRDESLYRTVEDQGLGGKANNEVASEISAWVNRSRKLEDKKKIEERIKAARMARMLEEQENADVDEDSEEGTTKHSLAGLRVRHGFEKVMEGGAVVLTLKDKNVIAGDDLNEEMDELENYEIAEQEARNEGYRIAKKKPGVYDDKFQNDMIAVRTILPQYDNGSENDEYITLDEFGGIGEKHQMKLEEIRKKLQGANDGMQMSLTDGAVNIASDYYTQEEMLQFKRPKKRKKLRKKDVLDLDALEAEAKTEGLGAGDLGNRLSTGSRREQEKAEEVSRRIAYENAFSKALNTSKKLREENAVEEKQVDDDEILSFGGEDDEELHRSLQRARQAALKKQAENGNLGSGPQVVVAALKQATLASTQSEAGAPVDIADKDKAPVVFTDTEEFCRSLQLDEIVMRRPVVKDGFAEEEDSAFTAREEEPLLEGGWTEVKETDDQKPNEQEKGIEDFEESKEPLKEVTVGKGLAGALHLLKERGTLKEIIDWGGRNMDKKKSKLVGIAGDTSEKASQKEILLERVDEFGRVMTPKEAFRRLSHKFHGKGPGKTKQEKKMKQYQEEMKLKQMNSGDTPLMSMEKMREAQAKMRTPYIVISGHIKPGQTSDPRSGFATVDKEPVGSLTPMLGDRKVEHFLGIKRKPDGGSMGPPPPKKPKAGI